MRSSTAMGIIAAAFLMAVAACADLPPLPNSLTIAGKDYAVEASDAKPERPLQSPPGAMRFGDVDPTARLDQSLRYHLGGATFLRTGEGRYALPFIGQAQCVGMIDLQRNVFVPYHEAFPATGGRQGNGDTPTPYKWHALVDDGPQPKGMWLFVMRWNREARKSVGWRGRVLFEKPAHIDVSPMDEAPVRTLLCRQGNDLVAEIDAGMDRTWARISMETWKVACQGKPRQETGHLGCAVFSPDKSQIWATYSDGLIVYSAGDGSEIVRLSAGRYFNAVTLGATFDPTGVMACVSTPYGKTLSLIDVKTHRLVAEYRTQDPLAGIVFDGETHKARAIQTFLPYE